jgi:hypothetical protein
MRHPDSWSFKEIVNNFQAFQRLPEQQNPCVSWVSGHFPVAANFTPNVWIHQTVKPKKLG